MLENGAGIDFQVSQSYFFLFCIRSVELVELGEFSMTESFSVSPTHSWLSGVVVKTSD